MSQEDNDNFLEELFQPLQLPKEMNHNVWLACQKKLLNAIVRQRGVHEDEFDNFDSYLEENLDMTKALTQITYVSSKDKLHVITFPYCYYVKPYERNVGIDNPETALLRGNYEGGIRIMVRYRRLRKSVPNPEKEQSDKKEVSDKKSEEDDEEEEEEEDSDSDDERYDEFVKNLDDDDEEEKEEEEEDEEENKGEKPAFYFESANYDAYDVEEYLVEKEHLLCDFPVWILSRLCHMRGPMLSPVLFNKPYLIGCAYIASRTLKLCPYEEYYINNRVIVVHNPQTVDIRSKFYHISKRHRTNCTLHFVIRHNRDRKLSNWLQPFRLMVEIPHEHKKYLSITVMAMAFGWSPKDFVQAIRMFLLDETSEPIEMLLECVLQDTENCTGQREAIRRFSKCLTKCRQMTDWEAISSYVSYTLRNEYLPNMVGVYEEDHESENLRKGYILAEVCAELIRISEVVNSVKKPEDRWQTRDKRSYALKRVDTPGEKLAQLFRSYLKHFNKKAASKLRNIVDGDKTFDLNTILNRKNIKLTASVKNGIWDVKSDTSDNRQNKTQLMITGFCADAIHRQTQKIIKYSMAKNTDFHPLLTHPSQMGKIGSLFDTRVGKVW